MAEHFLLVSKLLSQISAVSMSDMVARLMDVTVAPVHGAAEAELHAAAPVHGAAEAELHAAAPVHGAAEAELHAAAPSQCAAR